MVTTVTNQRQLANQSHIFIEWNTKANCTGDTYVTSVELRLTRYTILYTIWQSNIPRPVIEPVVWGSDKKVIVQLKTPTSGAPVDAYEVQLFSPTTNSEAGAWGPWSVPNPVSTDDYFFICLLKASGPMLFPHLPIKRNTQLVC